MGTGTQRRFNRAADARARSIVTRMQPARDPEVRFLLTPVNPFQNLPSMKFLTPLLPDTHTDSDPTYTQHPLRHCIELGMRSTTSKWLPLLVNTKYCVVAEFSPKTTVL